MEIYNEHVRDLLRPQQKSQTGKIQSLKVREHPKEGPFVQGDYFVFRLYFLIVSVYLLLLISFTGESLVLLSKIIS